MSREIKEHPIPQTPKQKKACSKEARAKLETLAAPLVEWIREYHDPYTAVHITWDRVIVEHESVSIPFPYLESSDYTVKGLKSQDGES